MIEEKILSLKGRLPLILDHEKCFKSAVLLPLVNQGSELCVLFEKRSHKLERQPGEICFPGGKIEAVDGDAGTAAVRETCEELGLSSEHIELIAPLNIMVSPFNAIIYPFAAYINNYDSIKANPDEVEQVFYVPLTYFLEHKPLEKIISLNLSVPDDFPFELIPHGENYPFRQGIFPQYFYIWQDKVIWGLTARILYHFVNLLNKN